MTLRRVSRTIAGRRVTAAVAPGQEVLADDVLATLARIATSEELRPGMTVRFGWSVLTLADDGDGGLIVCEPDFDGDPLRQTRPELVTTLDVLARQAALARRVGVEPADIGFEQFVVVARGALGSRELQLYRAPPSDAGDSGWSITSEEAPADPENDADFEATRVYAFLHLRPAILPVLILPVAFAVLMDGGNVGAVLDGDGRDRLAGVAEGT